MLASFKYIVKNKKRDIIMISIVVLLSLLSFAMGFIVSEHQRKETILMKYEQREF